MYFEMSSLPYSSPFNLNPKSQTRPLSFQRCPRSGSVSVFVCVCVCVCVCVFWVKGSCFRYLLGEGLADQCNFKTHPILFWVLTLNQTKICRVLPGTLDTISFWRLVEMGFFIERKKKGLSKQPETENYFIPWQLSWRGKHHRGQPDVRRSAGQRGQKAGSPHCWASNHV